MSRQEQAQQWLSSRFAGLTLEDFGSQVQIIVTADLAPPALGGFEGAWKAFTSGPSASPLLSAEESETTDAILIVCDPTQRRQIELLRACVVSVDSMGHDAPPILLVPHTVSPEARGVEERDGLQAGPLVGSLLEIGLDGIVSGEPFGHDLALHVCVFIAKSAAMTRTISNMVNERRSRAQRAEMLRECVDCILWDYLRARCASSIPMIDYDIPQGELTHIDGFTFTQVLGKGAFGTVYKLAPRDGVGGSNEVVKVIDKGKIAELQELKCLKRQIDVMRLVSSDDFRHPNVVQLYEVYHSCTHLFFRIEFGGPEDLYRRLSYREKDGPRCRPLAARAARSLVVQAVAGIAHLHLGPHVCHRDIKPENFIVRENGPEDIVLKVADFDLAVVQERGAVCRRPCGTVPFMAPEVLLEREYDAESADIWSLGIVLFEVHCGVRIVEKMLGLTQDAAQGPPGAGGRPDTAVAKQIKAGFDREGSAGQMLVDRCRPELRVLLAGSAPLLGGMLLTTPSHRISAEQMQAVAATLPMPPAGT